MPVPTERKAKSATPRATPSHCSPTAARLTSFSSVTGATRRSPSSSRRARPSRPGMFGVVSRSFPVPFSTTPGMPRTTPSIRSGGRSAAATSESRSATMLRVRRRRRRPGARRPDAPGFPAEVADRPAEEPRAKVEAQYEGRLRHRLEEDGAVARPLGIPQRLADEPRAESDRGPARRSASRSRCAGRSPPARWGLARMVSSTARSLMCLSSGGCCRMVTLNTNQGGPQIPAWTDRDGRSVASSGKCP